MQDLKCQRLKSRGQILHTLAQDNKKDDETITSIKKQKLSILIFFFIGLYGGFIHAGVGFLILSILSNYNGIQLSKANSIKVFVVFVYTFFALIVFIMENKINWILGINLGIGNSIGGWVASRWSYNKPDKIIKIFIIISSAIMAIKLWYF